MRALLALLLLGIVGCASKERVEESVAATKDPFETGADAYQKYCALCHGKDAEGYAADHAPSLRSPTFLASASDAFLTKSIGEGRRNTAMAGYGKAHGGPLDDAAIADIVSFLRADGPVAASLPKAPIVGNPAKGLEIFAERCQPCHGTPADRGWAVHLANANFLSAATDPFLRHAITRGRPGTAMPSFAGVLTDREIDDVVAAVRSWAGPVANKMRNPEPPPLGDDFIINPKGATPDFTLKSNRFVPNADVKKALEDGKRMVIIDARATSDWFGTRVPGSISIPYYAFDRLDKMPRDGTWVLAYCACPHHASGVVVDELRKRGFKKTAILDEGILAWKRSGYPVEGDATGK